MIIEHTRLTVIRSKVRVCWTAGSCSGSVDLRSRDLDFLDPVCPESGCAWDKLFKESSLLSQSLCKRLSVRGAGCTCRGTRGTGTIAGRVFSYAKSLTLISRDIKSSGEGCCENATWALLVGAWEFTSDDITSARNLEGDNVGQA